MMYLNIFVKLYFYNGIAVATFLSVTLCWASHMYARHGETLLFTQTNKFLVKEITLTMNYGTKQCYQNLLHFISHTFILN